MKRSLLLLSFLLSFSAIIFAQSNTVPDKWLALVNYANLKYSEVKTQCPHFPFYDINTKDVDFTSLRQAWQNKYSKEVSAFLAIPKIKNLNPSLVDLEIKKLGEENTTVKFEHTYWNMFLKSGLSADEISKFAPHFPFPKNTNDINSDVILYDKVFTDFTVLFPKEFIAFMNNEKVRTGSKIYGEAFNMDLAYEGDAYKSMYIEKVENKPERTNFDSGNPLLDQARYDATLKNWYFTYYRKDYYKIYDPSGYDAYMKALEDAGTHPEAGH
jgi:hypothetical protein